MNDRILRSPAPTLNARSLSLVALLLLASWALDVHHETDSPVHCGTHSPDHPEGTSIVESPKMTARAEPSETDEQLTLKVIAFQPKAHLKTQFEIVADITTIDHWRDYERAMVQGKGLLETLKSDRSVHCFIDCVYTDHLILLADKEMLKGLDSEGLSFTFKGAQSFQSPRFFLPIERFYASRHEVGMVVDELHKKKA